MILENIKDEFLYCCAWFVYRLVFLRLVLFSGLLLLNINVSSSRLNDKDLKYEKTVPFIDLTGIDNNNDNDRCYANKHLDAARNEHAERQERTQCGNYTFGNDGPETIVSRVSIVDRLPPITS